MGSFSHYLQVFFCIDPKVVIYSRISEPSTGVVGVVFFFGESGAQIRTEGFDCFGHFLV